MSESVVSGWYKWQSACVKTPATPFKLKPPATFAFSQT